MPDVRNVFWLVGLSLFIPACASAQVRVNSNALQQLQGIPSTPPAPYPQAAPPPAPKPMAREQSKASAHSSVREQEPLPLPPPAPGQPSAPDATPATTPPIPVIPPVARIDFAPGSADLPAEADATLKPFCTSPYRIPVLAQAPADPANPFAAMKLSMQRAFAIRAALIACGVSAQNIIPQADTSATGANSDEAMIGARIKS